jgi:hypothetical protein
MISVPSVVAFIAFGKWEAGNVITHYNQFFACNFVSHFCGLTASRATGIWLACHWLISSKSRVGNPHMRSALRPRQALRDKNSIKSPSVHRLSLRVTSELTILTDDGLAKIANIDLILPKYPISIEINSLLLRLNEQR